MPLMRPYRRNVRRKQSSSSESEVDDREIFILGTYNPLLNSLVLDTVFSYLPYEDLLNVRRVCHQWYEVSLKRWRSNSTLIIDDVCICESHCRTGARVKHTNLLTQFLDFFDQSSHSQNIYNEEWCIKPFSNFRCPSWNLCYHTVGLGVSLPDEVMSKFWGTFGSWMTHLEMVPVEINMESSEILKNLMFRHTPNLKTLICDIKFTGAPPGYVSPEQKASVLGPQLNLTRLALGLSHSCPFRWKEILEQFPNVKAFSPLHICQLELKEIRTALKAIHLMNKSAFQPTHIDFSPIFSTQTYFPVPDQDKSYYLSQLYSQLQFPAVTSACVNAGFPSFGLEGFFRSHCTTLKKLELVQKYLTTTANFGTTLDSLEELNFTLCHPMDLDFLRFTPNLKSLIIRSQRASKALASLTRERMKNFNLTLANLNRLEFDCTDNEGTYTILRHGIGVEKFKKLCEIMPNVTVLKIPLQNKNFRVICTYWRNLQELTVLPDGGTSGLNDDGITGLKPHQTWDKIKPSVVEKLPPNITMLKRLRYFAMPRSEPTSLTDKSVYMGFVKLSHLSSLKVTLPEVIKALISAEAKKKLLDHVPNAQI